MRTMWLAFGLAATGCGLIGIALPLVPTTPFLLVAVFAFARSSPRLHAWLVTHPRLGPAIHDWHQHRAINRNAKTAAIGVMAASLALSAVAGVSAMILLLQAVVLGAAATFILTRPSARIRTGTRHTSAGDA